MVGWCEGAGASCKFLCSSTSAPVLAVGTDGGCLDILSHIYRLSFCFLSLGDDTISTEILSQRAFKPKQPTNSTPYYSAFLIFASCLTAVKPRSKGPQRQTSYDILIIYYIFLYLYILHKHIKHGLFILLSVLNYCLLLSKSVYERSYQNFS